MSQLKSFLRKNLGWSDNGHDKGGLKVYHGAAFLVLAVFLGSLLLVSKLGQKPQPLDSSATGSNVVIYAGDISSLVGSWNKVSDSAAAGGFRLHNPNVDAPKVGAAQGNPANYFETTFTAEAGTPYHVWLRLKAENDAWANDSVYVQFSDSVNADRSPTYRIGTISAMAVQLEEGRDAGVQNWGWNDNDWGALGPHVYFAQSGIHTIRVQQREDGVSIDQIVISPAQYLGTSPGALKNDATIVAKPAPIIPPVIPPITSSLSSQDIGPVGIAGSLSAVNGVYTIHASGTDIWNVADGFRFSYQPMSGDGTVIARVTSARQVDEFTLAGVMIRENLNADSRQASMLVSPSGRAKFRYRANTAGATISEGPGAGAITLPRWVKVVRQGNNFSGYISTNGTTWDLVKSGTVTMGNSVYAGIAVTSHNNGSLTTAVLDQYSMTSSPAPTVDTTSPTVSLTAPLVGATLSGSAGLTATANDNVGVTKVEYYRGTTLLGSSTTGPNYTYNWNTGSVVNGSYSLTAKAFDAAGNVGASTPVSVTVSNGGSTTQFKALHWNAFQGSRTDSQNNFDTLSLWVANLNPHVVSINETYANHAVEYKNRIAQRTGVAWYSHFVQSQTDGVGNLILSRLPFVSTSSYTMQNNGEYRRNAIQATVNLSGKNVNFFSTHLDHNNSAMRSLQIDELKTYMLGFAEPRIVAGDFNANPGTAEMNKMGLTYVDAWAAARANLSDGIVSTSYSCNVEGRTRSSILDYQFYSKTAAGVTLKEARVVDTRDFNTTRSQVRIFLNPSENCDNNHVRPSDHNALLNTYEIN